MKIERIRFIQPILLGISIANGAGALVFLVLNMKPLGVPSGQYPLDQTLVSSSPYQSNLPDLEYLLSKDLFGPSTESTQQGSQEIDLTTAEISSLPFTIDAIVHKKSNDQGFAILSNRGDSIVIGIGDDAFGLASVVAISSDSIVFERNGQLERLEYERKYSLDTGTNTTRTIRATTWDTETNERKDGSRFEMPHTEDVDHNASTVSLNTPQLSRSALPESLTGVSMKVTPDSRPLLSLGLRPGDEIIEIEYQGSVLDISLSEAMQSLPPGSLVAAKIKRGPQTFYKSITLN